VFGVRAQVHDDLVDVDAVDQDDTAIPVRDGKLQIDRRRDHGPQHVLAVPEVAREIERPFPRLPLTAEGQDLPDQLPCAIRRLQHRRGWRRAPTPAVP
jgi:hypothetical protein